MTDKPKRRVQARNKPSTPEESHVRSAQQIAALSDYVYEQLGEEGEFQSELMRLLAHILATISDLRDAAAMAQTSIHSGNLREALQVLMDVVEATCDIEEKRAILENLFPDDVGEIDTLLRNPDGTRR